MLVDENDGNVFALLRERVEGSLDGSVVRLAVDDEEVLLVVGRRGDVLAWNVRPDRVLERCRGTKACCEGRSREFLHQRRRGEVQ